MKYNPTKTCKAVILVSNQTESTEQCSESTVWCREIAESWLEDTRTFYKNEEADGNVKILTDTPEMVEICYNTGSGLKIRKYWIESC